jgi:hypothetical protein
VAGLDERATEDHRIADDPTKHGESASDAFMLIHLARGGNCIVGSVSVPAAPADGPATDRRNGDHGQVLGLRGCG